MIHSKPLRNRSSRSSFSPCCFHAVVQAVAEMAERRCHSLEDENQRLREENERLRDELQFLRSEVG